VTEKEPSTLTALAAAAREDVESVVDLTAQLVKVPSRGGIDRYDPVLDLLSSWLRDHSLEPQELRDREGTRVGLFCEVRGAGRGPCWVLNACVDTAPFGDEAAWTHAPTAAVVDDGWLGGRGSSDSKVAAAMFCHVGRRVAESTSQFSGSLVLLFDADEHTGHFGGARCFFENTQTAAQVGGVLIGYPGMDELVVGSRGVLRAELGVRGVAGHSGASSTGLNAVVKASQIVQVLSAQRLPEASSREFPLQPKVSVTEISGGQGYTVTPDLCRLRVDVRTTPSFDAESAWQLLTETVHDVDRQWPGTAATEVASEMEWPPYVLADDAPIRVALVRAAESMGVEVRPKVSGPSNIGNYLATLGVPATAGFGVAYQGLHAVDERIDLSTVPTVQAVYHAAVLELLGAPVSAVKHVRLRRRHR
jgi:succinyl-diaminopimelate desuccinylase